MSNALANLEKQLAKEISEQKNELAKSIRQNTGSKISTMGKMFTFPDGRTDQGPINVIIIGWKRIYTYYPDQYDSQNKKPPSCYAIGMAEADMKPGDDVPNPEALSCEGCANNVFGSAQVGKGKACKNKYRVAVISPDAEVTDTMSLDEIPVYYIEVSPTGLGAFGNYIQSFLDNNEHPISFISQIGFNRNLTYPSLVFQAGPKSSNLQVAMGLRERGDAIISESPLGNDRE